MGNVKVYPLIRMVKSVESVTRLHSQEMADASDLALPPDDELPPDGPPSLAGYLAMPQAAEPSEDLLEGLPDGDHNGVQVSRSLRLEETSGARAPRAPACRTA